MKFDGDFFKSQGPPRSPDEIFPTSGLSNALVKINLDLERTTGNVRLIIGPRGIGKSTCLHFLARHVEKRLGKANSVVFNAGIHIPDMLRVDTKNAASVFFAQLARAISKGSTEKLSEVISQLEKMNSIAFVFVDNLDRLYENENDLELARYILKTGDPIFKDLSERLVVVFTAAPEWDAIFEKRDKDLGYLNYSNRILLAPITLDELEGQLESRAKQRGHKLGDYLTTDFVKALYVACQGNPREAFQLLENVATKTSHSLPLDGKVFREIIPEELYRGAIEKLRQAGSESPDISWGINQLARYFAAVEKSGRAIQPTIEMLVRGLDGKTMAVGAGADLGMLRHVAHRIDGGESWELNPQVKKAMHEWSKCGLPRDVLLTAFSQNSFISTTTDVQDRAEEFLPFLEFDAKTLRRFEESLADYGEIAFTPYDKWDRRELVRKSWMANQRLMQAILTIVDKQWDAQLDADLREPHEFYVASRRLIERCSALLVALGRHDVHKAELLSLRERLSETMKDPTSTSHWEDYQLAHIQQGAVKAYEGLMRQLPPKLLSKGASLPRDPEARTRELLDSRDSNHVVFFQTYGVNPLTNSKDLALLTLREETVTALLNTDGGTMVIGVDEQRKVLGLRADLNLIEPHTREALRSAMMDHLRRALGPVVDTLVRPEFVDAAGSEMCIVHIGGAEKPVFVKRDGARKYYRRENGENVVFEPSRRPIKLPRRRR